MKRILILFLAFALLMTGFPVCAGTLPSSELFSPFPSLTDATGKKPEQSDVLQDGSHRDTYTGITPDDYEAFSEYLETAGFDLVSYDVSNSVLTAVLQKGENAMTFSYNSANGTAVLTYPARLPEDVPPRNGDDSDPGKSGSAGSGEIVYTSRITGQPFTAEPGLTKGFSLSKRYNSSSSDLLLPDPVAWSRGALTRLGTEEAANGTYYQFQAVDKSKNEKLMMDYIEALKQLGYTCKKEKLMTLTVYHINKGKKELAAISLRSRVGKGSYMTCLLPSECSFEIEEEAAVKEYRLSSVYKEDTKEIYSVTGFDDASGAGSFSLSLSPAAYHEGDRFSLEDFLTQTHAGFNSSLYYCTFRTPADGDRPFSTLEYTMYQAGSSAYFKELTVEVLRKNASGTVLYFYLEADAGAGVHHQLEGLIDVVHEEGSVYTSSPEDGGSSVTKLKDCRVCGGKGFDTCPKCGGSGKVRCTKCGGDGRIYNTISKKEKDCSRCLGTGKQDCSSCTNGKRRCSFCGGDGHV